MIRFSVNIKLKSVLLESVIGNFNKFQLSVLHDIAKRFGYHGVDSFVSEDFDLFMEVAELIRKYMDMKYEKTSRNSYNVENDDNEVIRNTLQHIVFKYIERLRNTTVSKAA